MRLIEPRPRLSVSGLGFFVLLAFVILFAASPLFADEAPAASNLSRAGHYCVSCHGANDARLTDALAWNGSSARVSLSPCPTIQQLRWELVYTDDAFDSIANGVAEVASRGMSAQDLERGILARTESFPRVVETQYRSVDAGLNEARTFRYQLNKSYTQVQAERNSWTMNVMLVVGAVATLFLLASLGWGYYNTRSAKTVEARWLRIGPWSVLFVLIIFGVFALPIFNPPVQSEVATAADLERQTALDTATLAATSAENLSAKAWQLARLGAAWSSLDKKAENLALATALSATNELEVNAEAYWGRARALEESAVAWQKGADAATPLVQRIQAAASSAWTYAAMADETAATDSKRATELLNIALARAQRNPDPYFRATDIKAIAVAWSRVNRDQALTAANEIADPSIRAWALRELGQFDQAATSARQVDDANLRAFALREIALASKNPAWLDEALTTAQSLPNPARAYALSDIAAVWALFDASKAMQVANSIAPQFADARASVFRRIGRLAEAWSESEKMSAGFEQGRAQSEIIGEWARVSPNDALDAAKKIRMPFWNAEAQRAVAAALAKSDSTRALELARAIKIPFTRVRALTEIARQTRDAAIFEEAAKLADELRDPYPLRDLAIAWAALDPTRPLTLVDKLDRESDRVQALLIVALALAPQDRTQANAVFDRAVKQAQAARARGDPLYSSELLRELGVRYMSVDAAKAEEALNAALDAAQKVNVRY